MRTGLTPRQRLFALEYLKDLNSTRAAVRAGYAMKGADVAGARLLGNVRVAEEIQKGMDRRAKRLEISADRVLQEIASLAFANMGDYIHIQRDGSFFLDFSKVTRSQMAAIQRVSVEEFRARRGKNSRPLRRTRFRLGDKGANLELLGKHLGLFTEKHKHDPSTKVLIDFRNTKDAKLDQIISGAEPIPAT